MTDHQPAPQGELQPQPAPESTEWCRGLPLVENRALLPGEIEELNGEAARLRGRGCLMGCGAPLVFFIPIIFLASLDPLLRDSPANQGWFAIGMIFALAGMAAYFLKANDYLKQSKGLRHDIKAAYIKRFLGPSSLYQSDSVQVRQQEQTAPITAPSSSPTVEIEVLPCTRRLWLRDGQIVDGWEEVTWTEVAQTPQFASMAAAWVEPLQAPSRAANAPQVLDSNQHGQRDLSPAEKTELQRRARQAWLRPFWPAFFLTLWLAIPLSIQLFSGSPLRMKPQAFLLIFCTCFAYYALMQGLMTAWSLRRDVEIGIAVILKVPASLLYGFLNAPIPPVTPQETGDAVSTPTPEDPKEANTVIEILPFSKLDWTENGKPSAWRKIPDR